MVELSLIFIWIFNGGFYIKVIAGQVAMVEK